MLPINEGEALKFVFYHEEQCFEILALHENGSPGIGLAVLRDGETLVLRVTLLQSLPQEVWDEVIADHTRGIVPSFISMEYGRELLGARRRPDGSWWFFQATEDRMDLYDQFTFANLHRFAW